MCGYMCVHVFVLVHGTSTGAPHVKIRGQSGCCPSLYLI